MGRLRSLHVLAKIGTGGVKDRKERQERQEVGDIRKERLAFIIRDTKVPNTSSEKTG